MKSKNIHNFHLLNKNHVSYEYEYMCDVISET